MRRKVRRVVIDPVCGERMKEAEAVASDIRGERRFFCSEECAARFLNAPWRFEDEEFDDQRPTGE